MMAAMGSLPGGDALQLPQFSVPAFLALLVCLLGGTAMFYQLARRWTAQRPRAAVEEWAAARRFGVRWRPRAAVPAALQQMAAQRAATAEATLVRGPLVLVRLVLPAAADADGGEGSGSASASASASGSASASVSAWRSDSDVPAEPPTAAEPSPPPLRWHVLIRQTDRVWTGAGLKSTGERSAEAAESLVEAMGLSAFPALLWSDRFVVHAAESRAARAMARAPARGLLPPDVGLLLHGPYVMLDFSSRPFDTVEFDRMLAVMEQLKDHLPTGNEAA